MVLNLSELVPTLRFPVLHVVQGASARLESRLAKIKMTKRPRPNILKNQMTFYMFLSVLVPWFVAFFVKITWFSLLIYWYHGPSGKNGKTWHQYIYLARTLNCVLGSVKMDELSQGGPRPDARRVCRGARVQGGSDERVPRGQRAEGPRGSKGQEGPRAQWVQTGQRLPLFRKSNYFKMWNFQELLV